MLYEAEFLYIMLNRNMIEAFSPALMNERLQMQSIHELL